MRVSADITVSVYDITVVRKSLNLAALFATAARAVREVNRIENRTMPPRVIPVAPHSQEEKSSVRRVTILNAKLPHQQPCHIDSVGFKMSGFMVSSDSAEDLLALSKRLKQIHHRRQFFHRREVYINITKAGLQSAVKQIASQYAVRIVVRVDIINVLAYSIVIRMRVSVMVVSKDEKLYGLVVSR